MNLFQASIGAPRKILIVINGESNSGGYALNSEAQAGELDVCAAVKILDNTGLSAFQDLDIGTNNLVGHAGLSNGTTHGFELELSNRAEVRPFYRQPCYLVKTGQGGSTIAQWADGQSYWNTFKARVDAAKALLSGVQYRTFILFSIGINDAIAGTNVNTWKTAVQAHFANMREELGATTPIIMTEFQGMGSGGNQYASYNTAIQEIAAADPYTYSVNTSGAGLRDVNHWNYAGMKQVAGAMLDIVESL